MNFDYSPDQRLLKEEARRFLTDRCPPAAVRTVLDDPARSYHEGLWQQIAEMGWLGAAIPEADGGLGLSHVELCALAEELGRALAPVPFSSTVYAFAEGLVSFGTLAQRAHWLPKVAQGGCIGCVALSEGAGAPWPRRPVVRFESGRLHGTKLPVTDGDVAHAAIVLAQGVEGPGLVLVDLSLPGVTRQRLDSLDPTRGLASLGFESVHAEVLGTPGQGLTDALRIQERLAALLSFEQIGGADRCLEMARDFALQRHAFGRAIGSYQAIKHKLADAFVRNELARSNAYYAAWALDQPAEKGALALAAPAARIAASDAYWYASKENIQVHGGMGFTWEVDAHLYYRRAQHLALAAGAPVWWKERLVQQLEQRLGDAPQRQREG